MFTRREVIKTGASASAAVGLNFSSPYFKGLKNEPDDPDLLNESDVIAIAKRAVDVSISFGAVYADVRIIRNVIQQIGYPQDNLTITQPGDEERTAIGVRVLVDGCFGFASSPFIDMDEAAILAKAAVDQAKENSAVKPRDLDWSTMPKQKGRWISPGKDPFLVPIEERLDFINAWREEAKGYRDGRNAVQLVTSNIRFSRVEKFMVNSEGSEVSQVLYFSQGSLDIAALIKGERPFSGPHVSSVSGLEKQQGGWEIFENASARKQIPEMVERSVSLSKVGVIPVDVGRYDLVFAGNFAGALVGETFGQSTQLDLAIGYEANAGGTSYLGPDPLSFLGTQVAKDTITIHCDRSGTGKLATAKWDDEGVTPIDFDIVRDGILVDYQTTRDTAAIIQKWYDKEGMNTNPKGCASSQSGFTTPLQATPNLKLIPSKSDNKLADMISNVKKGFIVYSGIVSTSFNIREGFGSGMVREIRDGKLGDFATNFQIMFSTPEIWKNIVSVGDATTVQRNRSTISKGQPQQRFEFSVDAPALLVKDVPVIDPTRKA